MKTSDIAAVIERDLLAKPSDNFYRLGCLVDFGADCSNGVELAAALAGEHTHSVCKRYFLDVRQTSGINKVLSLRSSIPIHLKWIDPLLDVKARIVYLVVEAAQSTPCRTSHL
jgi:hypothetical protein